MANTNFSFSNESPDNVYFCLYYTCPVPNSLTSLAWFGMQGMRNMTYVFTWQMKYSYIWSLYNAKRPGIFSTDNQLAALPRTSNSVSFTNVGGPHFTGQAGAPNDEFSLKVISTVPANFYYGGLCLDKNPIYAEKMAPGSTQRYPLAMQLNFGYGYSELITGQVINPALITSVPVNYPAGCNQLNAKLDSNGKLTITPGNMS